MQTPSRSIALAGGTGLVGGEVLRRLLADPSVERVVALVRRDPGWDPHPKLDVQIVDFDRLHEHDDLLRVDQVACALGTTIKQAGSQERFRQVDLEYPFELARIGVQRGARHFLLVSALGADADARTFYNRVKGELEEAVRALPYRSVTILRPSLLLGEREETRLGEEVAKRFALLLPPTLKAIEAGTVAEALVAAAREDRPGVQVIASREMRRRYG